MMALVNIVLMKSIEAHRGECDAIVERNCSEFGWIIGGAEAMQGHVRLQSCS